MNISKIASQRLELGPKEISQAAPSSQPLQSFSQIMDRFLESQNGLHQHFETVQVKALTGSSFSPRELLLLQVQMGRFNMQVELVSKAAEAGSATLKKLQGS